MPASDPVDDTAMPTALYDARSLRYDRVMAQANFKQEPLYMQNAIAQYLLMESITSDFRFVQSAIYYCRPAEVARSARSQTCDSIAETIGEQGKSYMDVAVAVALGKQGRLSDAQMAKLEAEKADYFSRMERLASGVSAYSCEGMALTVKYLADSFARGDRAMMAGEPAATAKVKP